VAIRCQLSVKYLAIVWQLCGKLPNRSVARPGTSTSKTLGSVQDTTKLEIVPCLQRVQVSIELNAPSLRYDQLPADWILFLELLLPICQNGALTLRLRCVGQVSAGCKPCKRCKPLKKERARGWGACLKLSNKAST
jgi:hypothetical protein